MLAIEKDSFPFEFLSRLAERESWRKEIHRPVYHVHKWWAKRLGSVFRGILLGSALKDTEDVEAAFYKPCSFDDLVVFDPFMGSGTTIGEAHKLGFTALGRDINPVATEAVEVGLGVLDKDRLRKALAQINDQAAEEIRKLYSAKDSRGRDCEVLYYFWVMQSPCPECKVTVDLFPSYVFASNAYPKRKPEVQVICPACGDVSRVLNRHEPTTCRACMHFFQADDGPAKGTKARCHSCASTFSILESMNGQRPAYRLYAKLVLTHLGTKEYLPATDVDRHAYARASEELFQEVRSGGVQLPTLTLQDGNNTRQAMGYGFRAWRDFFNDRQLLALTRLRREIDRIEDLPARRAMRLLFSGALEFNNLFTSYKGEGTGAVRHMFSHHILKPERVPIEANLWGTSKSSGSFTGLSKTRLLRAIKYRQAPTEVGDGSGAAIVSAPPFSGRIEDRWPVDGRFGRREIYISCGDSSETSLPSQSIDFVVTDPPFFDNVHYSELADFFFAWRADDERATTTRHSREVQDADALRFADKLTAVFRECHRVLKDDGLLVFTYHHSRLEGWSALAKAILGSGFGVVNSHPVKAEMSGAQPKNQAKEPIQLDIVVICRKLSQLEHVPVLSHPNAVESGRLKMRRMEEEGFVLSRNDRKVIIAGQLLATVRAEGDIGVVETLAEREIASFLSSVEPVSTVVA
ncbi:MAG: DNA methyltransferase [Betaproteobacteria bacterium]